MFSVIWGQLPVVYLLHADLRAARLGLVSQRPLQLLTPPLLLLQPRLQLLPAVAPCCLLQLLQLPGVLRPRHSQSGFGPRRLQTPGRVQSKNCDPGRCSGSFCWLLTCSSACVLLVSTSLSLLLRSCCSWVRLWSSRLWSCSSASWKTREVPVSEKPGGAGMGVLRGWT